MIGVVRGIVGFLPGIGRQIITHSLVSVGFLQAGADLIATAGSTCESGYCACLSKSRCGRSPHPPHLLSFSGNGRLPDREVMSAGGHRNRLSHLTINEDVVGFCFLDRGFFRQYNFLARTEIYRLFSDRHLELIPRIDLPLRLNANQTSIF